MPSDPMICLGLVLLLVNVVGGGAAVIGGAVSLRRGIRKPAYRRTPSAITAILLGLAGWGGLIAFFLFDR